MRFAPAARRGGPSIAGASLASAWAVAALALGAAAADAAFAGYPLVVPAGIAVIAVAAVSLSRPDIGTGALLAAIPLVTVIHPTGSGKLALTLGAFYLFVIALWTSSSSGGSGRFPRLTIWVVVFLVATIVALAISPEPGPARQIVRGTITGVMLFFTIALVARDRQGMGSILKGVAVAALVVGAVATFDYLTGRTSATDAGFVTGAGQLVARTTAGFSQPNQLGGFLALLFPLCIVGALVWRRLSVFYIAAAAFAAVGVYASFSRGALMGLLLVPFAFIRGRRLLVMVPLLVMVAAIASPKLLQERFATLTTSGGEVATRVQIWDTAIVIWKANPILGVGLADFGRSYAVSRTPTKSFLPQQRFVPPPHAHNIELQLLAEQGLVGLIAFFALFVAAGRAALSRWRSADRFVRATAAGVLAALAAFLVHNQFDVTLFEPSTGLYLWALLGIASAVASMPEPEAAQPAERGPQPGSLTDARLGEPGASPPVPRPSP